MTDIELYITLNTIIPILIAISCHEFAHAYVAYKHGDTSQKAQGRLTLAPWPHIDIIGFISLILFNFGWGKPVTIDVTRLEDRRKSLLKIAIAGPIANLIVALVFTILLKIVYVVAGAFSIVVNDFLRNTLMLTIQVNVVLAVFNLIPIPPLDGSKVLFYFLPTKYKNVEIFLTKYSFLLILILIITNISNVIISPVITLVSIMLSLLIGV